VGRQGSVPVQAATGEGSIPSASAPAGTEERGFDWREGEGFKIDIYESNLPLRSNVVTFALAESAGGTRVSVSPNYTLKFGPFGMLMDKLMVRRQFEQGMEGLLAGLKYHVETGNEVGDKVPAV